MKKILNEYDDTKKMLKALRSLSTTNNLIREQYDNRNGYENKSIKHDSDDDARNDVDVINSVDVNLISSDQADLEFTEQQRVEIANLIDSFREQVSQTANLEPGFTFVTGQGRLDGVIQEYDMKFVFIAGENAGVYLNAQMLNLENEVVALIEKLVRFQEQFNAAIDTIIRERQNN